MLKSGIKLLNQLHSSFINDSENIVHVLTIERAPLFILAGPKADAIPIINTRARNTHLAIIFLGNL